MGNIKTYSVPVKNFTFESEANSQFLKTKFFAIAEGDNLNKSSFMINGIEECQNSEDYAMKPILGSWQKNKTNEFGGGDFGGHDSELDIDNYSGEFYNTYLGEKSERPLGLILPKTAKIETYKDKQWLSFEGLIWSKYNREAVSLLKKKRKNNVSVEIEVLESHEDERGYEIITKFTLLGITVIGVEAGIPNACLDVMEFAKTPQYNNFVRAFSKAQEENTCMEFMKQEDYGTGETLKLDLTRESASNDRWGDIKKTTLRNNLLKAKNYKTIIPKAYLVVEDGWEEKPSEKLKYPIVQIKGNEVVLNINGVQSASAYLMKEKNEPYFAKAKAKLNKIRKMLGMEKVFGIEWNDDWGEIVAEKQPSIIKMEDNEKVDKKEMKAKLCSLFADKEEKSKAYIDSKKAYEDKMGEFEYAEDDKKEVCEKEMNEAKDCMSKFEQEVLKCEKDIIELAKCMSEDEDEDDKEEIDDEEEEYPIDTEKKDKYVKAMADKGIGYVSNSKSYIVGEKDGELYACKYECGEDNEIKMADEQVKCEKVYAIFKVGGSLDKSDNKELPKVQVEFGKGLSNVYARVKDNVDKMAKADVANAEYKKMLSEDITKLEEMACDNDMPMDYKKEVMSKIFANEFKSSAEMETQVKAKLYELHKNSFLSGEFAKKDTDKKVTTETDEINKVLKNYNIKK